MVRPAVHEPRAKSLLVRWIEAASREPWRAVAQIASFSIIVLVVAVVMAPWMKDPFTFGFHDWDSQTAHRELVRDSLLRHHELPWWNPYACGGFPAWGYVEADTILVSPWLFAYLALPMSLALRIEVAGMALLGGIGAYLAASRFTKSQAARALVVALWAVNGRWGLQTASGHTWHLAYAYLPWCLFFFERARQPNRKLLDVAALAASLAMLVYAGGIYPLPHTVLVLGLYAMAVAIAERRLRPLVTLAIAGLLAVGLAAPKLLPVVDGFRRAPRLIESTEALDLGALVTMLTSRDQAFYSRPARVSPYGWHEWGIYVSSIGLAVILTGFVLVRGRRETALKIVGAIFVILGFGAFHPDAPWPWMHAHLPVFRSQHVPSRFLYPAVLVLAIVAAAGLGRLLWRHGLHRPWLDFVATVIVALVALDVARVSARPMADAMWMVPPDSIRRASFHFETEPPIQYKKRDWAGPMYLALLANTGVLNCYGAPPFDGKGARASTDPKYRGEVHVEGASGSASIAAWSPNHVDVDVDGAGDGALLVYNMNYDESWSASVSPGGSTEVVRQENTIAAKVPPGRSRVSFRYYPRTLNVGLLLCAATVAALALLFRRERAEEAP
jgi:hypothetical protein